MRRVRDDRTVNRYRDTESESYLKKGGLTDEQIASVEAYITSP